MNLNSITNAPREGLVLVLGGTGKTGRRIAALLEARGIPTRIGSRAAVPAFDWSNEPNWDECLDGVRAAYISYSPDLAMPGASDSIRAFVDKARRQGLEHLVLLSGRGEEEAQICEHIVQDSGIDWTVVRASWFNQNFSEGAFLELVQSRQITLPDVDTPEPYVDAEDIAEVAVAALTEPGHVGEIYEVTGPRMLTLSEIAAELSHATGEDIAYVPVPHDAFIAGVADSGAPKDVVWMLDYLFSTVMDGRNSHLADGVQRALGRPPRDFTDFARASAASGVWRKVA